MTKTHKLVPFLLMAALMLPCLAQANETAGRNLSKPIIQDPPTGLHLDTSEDLTSLRYGSKSGLNPYLGATVLVEADDSSPDNPGTSVENETDLPYHLGAGIDCNLSEHARLDVDYRFHTKGLPNLGDVFNLADSDTPDSHQVSVGLRFAF